MIEGKKISKLDPTNSLNDSCCFPVLSRGATRRITFSALINNIIAKLPDATQEEIDEIRRTISSLEKQIEAVSIDNKEVEELLKDVTFTINGQNDTILEYTAKIREFEQEINSSSIAESIQKAKSSLKQLVVPGMFFEDMGLTYLGPVDGHDIGAMTKVLAEAKRMKRGVVVHVLTQKGKGYGPAEKHPARFHGAEPFDVKTGLPKKIREKANYTDVFSTVMCKLGAADEKIVAITAAMPDGTGLKRFHNMFPAK